MLLPFVLCEVADGRLVRDGVVVKLGATSMYSRGRKFGSNFFAASHDDGNVMPPSRGCEKPGQSPWRERCFAEKAHGTVWQRSLQTQQKCGAHVWARR